MNPTAFQILRAALEKQASMTCGGHCEVHARDARAALEAAAKASGEYPGQDDPWGDYLHFRAILIAAWCRDGRSAEAIARDLSMDPIQVILIGDAYQRGTR